METMRKEIETTPRSIVSYVPFVVDENVMAFPFLSFGVYTSILCPCLFAIGRGTTRHGSYLFDFNKLRPSQLSSLLTLFGLEK